MPVAYKQFKYPPIKEAIFVIIFKEIIQVDRLNLFRSTQFVKENFPRINPGISFEISNKINTQNSDKKPEEGQIRNEIGYVLQSGNSDNRLIQVNSTHISYHNLNKYAGWEAMYTEFRKIWDEFCKSVGQSKLSQLSVRYINHIHLPLPFQLGFGEYIRLLPSIPAGISPDLNNFFLQISVPNKEKDLLGIITETFSPLQISAVPKTLNFILDLTVLKNGLFNSNSDEIWNTFLEIRDYKNILFKSCITEKTENLFDHE